jgi:hypothetical protein
VLSDLARAEKIDESKPTDGQLALAEQLKKRALEALQDLAGATTPPPSASALGSPCIVSYPVAAAGESTVGLGQCTSRLSGIGIFLGIPCLNSIAGGTSPRSCPAPPVTEVDSWFVPSSVRTKFEGWAGPGPPVTKVSSWAVLSKIGTNTGACTRSGNSLECKLNSPMPLTSLFIVGFAPPLKAGEKIVFDLTLTSGKVVAVPVIVPAGPKLTVSATAAADTSGGAAAGIADTIQVKVAGGPFQNFFINVPSGNRGNVATGPPEVMTPGLSCGSQTATGGGDRWICNPTPGTSATLPAGTYSFVYSVQNPLPPGTVLQGGVTGTGVVDTTFTVKTP